MKLLKKKIIYQQNHNGIGYLDTLWLWKILKLILNNPFYSSLNRRIMKLKIKIKHFIMDSVLFEFETENNTIKKTLEEAVSQRADLRAANLWRADLQRANLRRADLRRADLRGANLWRADLWRANLRGADLQRANLRGANLWGANLWGANLWGAKGLQMYWHIHHHLLAENLTEPFENRVKYIKEEKSKEESPKQIKLRLKLLKKVKAKKLPKTQEGWEKLHRLECKNCPWTGTSIFKDKI